jgi:hypothetical protein
MLPSNFIVKLLDHNTEQFVQNVKNASARLIAEKIEDALFLDTERHGVDADGRLVKIYMNKNQLIEKTFKQIVLKEGS